MKVNGRDYCLRLENDADDSDCLVLYEGSMALGLPVAACSYLPADSTPSLIMFADEVPPAALEWLREEAQRRLRSPDARLPYLESDRKPIWYYVGGAVAFLSDAMYRWRHVANHGGISTDVLVVAASLFLLVAYLQHRRERQPTAD